MGILLTILITLLIISAVITALLILFQDDQGSGMGLFGSSGQSPFSSGDSFLCRLTKIFGIAFLVFCLAVAFMISRFGVNHKALQEAQLEFESHDESIEESWFLKDPDVGSADVTDQASGVVAEEVASGADGLRGKGASASPSDSE